MSASVTIAPSKTELTISRFVKAPRGLVFMAFTDPRLLQKWFGPAGFSITTYNSDIREGGHWRFDMVGPDGTVYKNLIEYTKIINPELISYNHGTGDANDPDKFQAEISLENSADGTLVNMTVKVGSEERIQDLINFGAVESGKSTLEKLDAQLASLQANEMFYLERELNAPVSLVYEVFTKAEHLAKWWGPKGFKVISTTVDLKQGGTFLYGMSSPEGFTMWGKFAYHEIIENERMVFSSHFSNENGGVVRHPLSETWPMEMLSVIDFEDVEGKTLLKLRAFAKYASEIENKTFVDNIVNMQIGWNGTFEQLTEYLAAI